jgi:uncharacterized integral membrane protein
MRGLLKLLILAPLALILLAFSMANRQIVMLHFDPLMSGDAASQQAPAPLYMVVIGAVMVGVIFGSASTWLGQGRHRKALRAAKANIEGLRRENEILRAQNTELRLTPSASTSTAVVPTHAA